MPKELKLLCKKIVNSNTSLSIRLLLCFKVAGITFLRPYFVGFTDYAGGTYVYY